MMIVSRPLEPPEWTGLILDTNLTDQHKELWQGGKVKMKRILMRIMMRMIERVMRMLMKANNEL